MSSYQVPQFLDSGDKILGPLNLRQFGYALGGFMISMITFSLTNTLFPGLGALAWAPAVPVALLATYLALGKFNGRDSDIYVYKFVLFVLKSRFMTYQRHPYVDDLYDILNDWTQSKILARWQSALTQKSLISQNEFLTFSEGDKISKAAKIRRLGQSIDSGVVNAMTEVERRMLAIKAKEAMLNQLKNSSSKFKLNYSKPGQTTLFSTPTNQQVNPKLVSDHNLFDAKPLENFD